jgi:hypothetical protein
MQLIIIGGSMMKVNDKVKVHLYDTRNKEIKTRQFDKVFTVYEKRGRIGIDWNTERNPFSFNDDDFTPFETFSHTVIFENVENGELFHFDTISNSIIKIA